MNKVPHNSPIKPVFFALTTLFLINFMPPKSGAHETERYTMLETENGIVRLDKQTGAISTCKNTASNWSCQPMDEASNAHNENETIAALRRENQNLRRRLDNLKTSETEKLDSPNRKLTLPSDEDVDQAIQYMEKMIRKFGGAMKRLQENQDEEPHEEL